MPRQVVTTVALVLCIATAQAQDTRVMPLDQVKNILNLTRDSWISFREFNGQQLIYFTPGHSLGNAASGRSAIQ